MRRWPAAAHAFGCVCAGVRARAVRAEPLQQVPRSGMPNRPCFPGDLLNIKMCWIFITVKLFRKADYSCAYILHPQIAASGSIEAVPECENEGPENENDDAGPAEGVRSPVGFFASSPFRRGSGASVAAEPDQPRPSFGGSFR